MMSVSGFILLSKSISDAVEMVVDLLQLGEGLGVGQADDLLRHRLALRLEVLP